MDQELANHIAVTAFRSAADLTDLIPMLQEFCSEEESREYGMALAAASAAISQHVLNKIYAAYPEVKAEFERKLQKYERVF